MLKFSSVPRVTVALLGLVLAGAAHAETAATAGATATPRNWTVSLQGGFTNTFQLVLGGYFGDGPDWQNRATVSLNNAFRKGDSLSVFGWATTDLPTATPNYQFGMLYKAVLLKRGRHTLTNTSGLQRWVLPMVRTGALDWHYTNNITYSATGRGHTFAASADSWHMFKSTLPLGNAVYAQLSGTHPLWKKSGYSLALKHGPAYTYSWGLYGANGNRVFRYSGGLVFNAKGTTVEGGVRQQWGLQDGIKEMRYWSILVSRTFSNPFSRQ